MFTEVLSLKSDGKLFQMVDPVCQKHVKPSLYGLIQRQQNREKWSISDEQQMMVK